MGRLTGDTLGRCKFQRLVVVPEDTVVAWFPCYTVAVDWDRAGYLSGKAELRMMNSCCNLLRSYVVVAELQFDLK